MKRYLLTALLLVNAAAHAAPGIHLTPQQCTSYPFVVGQHKVTHKDLIRELEELEAEGYSIDDNSDDYPDDLWAAQDKLNQDYQRDCVPHQTAELPHAG
ncbi:MAG TPA: DUF4148 domain-containing protein [Paraburkholderia sp.]|nr:DUF4148 domain-containing protein [Paraburkholderia sp.]